MQKTKTFILAFLAGVFISIGGCVNLLAPDKTVGAIMFSVGLYSIVCFSLNLFTGKVGYWIDNGLSFVSDLGIILLGNFAGTFIPGVLLSFTRQTAIREGSASLVMVKLADTPLSIFILAIFCGILMFTAVELYKRTKNPLGIFVCVPVFILSGFEHCIANMGTFTMGFTALQTTIDWSTLPLHMLISTIGNIIGGSVLLGLPVYLTFKD